MGAPWITNPAGLADALNSLGLAGVLFQPVNFQPTASVYAGQMVGGVRLVVTDREAIRPVSVGLALGRMILDRYPAQVLHTPGHTQGSVCLHFEPLKMVIGDPTMPPAENEASEEAYAKLTAELKALVVTMWEGLRKNA